MCMAVGVCLCVCVCVREGRVHSRQITLTCLASVFVFNSPSMAKKLGQQSHVMCFSQRSSERRKNRKKNPKKPRDILNLLNRYFYDSQLSFRMKILMLHQLSVDFLRLNLHPKQKCFFFFSPSLPEMAVGRVLCLLLTLEGLQPQ